jgi:hypothetical protein
MIARRVVVGWLVLFVFMLMATAAMATEVTLQWTLPTLDCEGNPLDQSTLGPLEIYISESTIPASGAPCSEPADTPPSGFTPVTVPPGATEVTIDLEAGKTYFFRSRVQGPGAKWSNMSNEATHTIDHIQVQPPTVLIIG